MCHMPVDYIEAVLLIITSCILYTLTILYFLYNLYIIHVPLNSSKPDPVYEDPDPQLEENIAYVEGEPAKEDEGEGGYEAYSL